MRRLTITLTLLLACIASMYAQVSFSAIVERQVVVGQKFAVTFRLKNGEGSGLKAPQIKGCKYLYGPSMSTMSSTRIINGNVASSTTIDYSFIYLAEKEGATSVPPTAINVGSQKYTSSATSFTVLPDDGRYSRQSPGVRRPSANPQPSGEVKRVGGNDVFVRIHLSKSKVYEQEALLCTIKMYLNPDYGLDGQQSQIVMQPSFDGFMVEELSVPPTNNLEHYNGRNYRTSILKQCLLFPQRSGNLTITSGKYTLTVQQYQTISHGYYYVQQPVDTKLNIESNTATVNVMPLPQPRPADFSGAVGQFKVNTSLEPQKLRTGEAGVLTFTISGTGNLKYIKEPHVDFPSEIEVYTPKSTQDVKVSSSNVTGTNKIEYTFTPQSVGTFTISPGSFSYFDINTKQYVSVQLPSYSIKVEQGSAKTTLAGDQQDIVVKNTDILPIHRNDSGLSKSHTIVVDQWWYWAIYGALALALVATVIISAKRIRRNANVAARNYAKARKVASRRLKTARQLIKSQQTQLFYPEITHAIWGYLSHKLAIPTSMLTRDNVATKLAEYGASDELINQFIDVLDHAEMAQYAPSQYESQAEDIYNEAATAMDSMESIKHNKAIKA